MDSKLLYAVVQALESKIVWQQNGESEWIYLGYQNKLDIEKLLQKVNKFFSEEQLLIKKGRRDSIETTKNEINKNHSILDNKTTGYILCNASFNKFIEVSSIDIIRVGEKFKYTNL